MARRVEEHELKNLLLILKSKEEERAPTLECRGSCRRGYSASALRAHISQADARNLRNQEGPWRCWLPYFVGRPVTVDQDWRKDFHDDWLRRAVSAGKDAEEALSAESDCAASALMGPPR